MEITQSSCRVHAFTVFVVLLHAHFCSIKFQSYVKKFILNHRLPSGSCLFRFGWNYIFAEFGVCAVNGNHLVKLYFVDTKFACGLVVAFLRPKFPPYDSWYDSFLFLQEWTWWIGLLNYLWSCAKLSDFVHAGSVY